MPYIYAIIYYLLVFPSAYALIGNPEDIIPNIDTDGKLISFTTPTSMISSIIAYAIGIAGIL